MYGECTHIPWPQVVSVSVECWPRTSETPSGLTTSGEIKIPYYDGNPSNLEDFILDWEDFAEEVVGEMRGAPRDKWVCWTFPHRLAQDLKEELRDQIRQGVIQTEQACLQWLEDEERVDAPNQKLEDLWSIPLPLERGELRVREGNRYIRKYRTSLKLVEDWNEASQIRHLLKDVLPGHWKTRVEDEEKKRAKKRVAVRIMASEDTHAGIMEFFWRNLGEPSPMFGLKNAVYVEVFGDTMGQRLMRLNNVEWRRGEPLRMQVIFARMSLDEIVKYITVELKLNAKNEAHVQDRQGQGHRGHREDRHHREVKGDTVGTAEEGSGRGQDLWTATSQEDYEEAHFFAFVEHTMKENGQDRSRWNRLDPRTKNGREPRRIGNRPLSFREYRSQHTGCWVCYGKGNNHAHDHRHCKVYEEDKKTYFAAHPDKKPKEQRIADWKAKGGDGGKGQGKGQGKGRGKGYGGGPGPDRRVRSIEEVAEDMLRTLEELKAQQRGGQSLSGSQQEGAAAGHVYRSPHGSGTSEVSPPKISGIPEKAKAQRVPNKAPEEPKPLSLATPNPWSALPREVYVGKGRGKKEGATTECPVDGQDQPKIYTICDHTLEVLMHPDVLELHAVRVVHTPHGDERQLHLKVRVRCGQEELAVDVLVDTGAQVSLVRRGLSKEESLQSSRRPVRLKVANGEILFGGTHEATISMEFWEHERLNRPDLGKRSTLSGNFYVADITDWDMIMGYDFMVGNAVGALPIVQRWSGRMMNALHGCPRTMHADHPNGMLMKRIGSSERCKLWVPSPEETAEFSSLSMEWRRRCMTG